VAKKVRTETGIAAGSVSVSSIAVDLAAKIFEELRGKRVLLVGAGKMGESAAKHLAKQGAKLFVLNRSRERAVELAAACGGEPRGVSELVSELAMADIAICSTSSDRFVITTELMKEVARARKYRTLFLIDIAVPRDVDPRVGQMENVFLYDVDDLQKVAEENLSVRRREADLAERIVEREVADFEAWRRQQNLKPLIVGLRAHVRTILAAELERTLPKLGADPTQNKEAVERAIDAATNKLLHPVLAEIKKAADEGRTQVLDDAPRLFGLDLTASRTASREAPPSTAPPSAAKTPAR
jgi:glutamyl-tRNA reductase